MLSVASAGGTIWTYSSRFTLTGMTGSFSAAVAAANLQVTGTTGPDPVNAVAGTGATASAAAGAWGTPYNLQTGLTKYAPMQPVPPTAITATNTAPLWPTSSVAFATTFLPIPSQVTTLTQANTFSVSSHANTVHSLASYEFLILTYNRLLLRHLLQTTCNDSSTDGRTNGLDNKTANFGYI